MLSCVKVSAVVKVPQMYPTTVSACVLLLALVDATATMNRSEAAFHNEPLCMLHAIMTCIAAAMTASNSVT